MKWFHLSVFCAFLVSVREGESIKLLGRLRDLIHGTTTTTTEVPTVPEYEKNNSYDTYHNTTTKTSWPEENPIKGGHARESYSTTSPPLYIDTPSQHSYPGAPESSTPNYGSYPQPRETTEHDNLYDTSEPGGKTTHNKASAEGTTKTYPSQGGQDSYGSTFDGQGTNSQNPQNSDNHNQKQSSNGYKPGLGTNQQQSSGNNQQYSSNNNDQQQNNEGQQSSVNSESQPIIDDDRIVFPDFEHDETTTRARPPYVPQGTQGQNTTEPQPSYGYGPEKQTAAGNAYVEIQSNTEGSYVPYGGETQSTTENSFVPPDRDSHRQPPLKVTCSAGVKVNYNSQGTNGAKSNVPLVDTSNDNALFQSTTPRNVPVPKDGGKTVINAPEKDCAVGKKLDGGKCRTVERK